MQLYKTAEQVAKIEVKYTLKQGGGGRRGLGPRNGVLTTCKVVTQRGGQRIIIYSIFPTVNILEARIEANRQRKSEMLKKLKKIISCIFVFLAYRICLSVLKLRGKPC